jgi:glutathione S-transferase
MLAPAELRALHPLGKSPIVTNGDRTLAESSVIIQYLLDQYGEGRLRPEMEAENYYDYLFYLHQAEGSLMPYLFLAFVMTKLAESPVPLPLRPLSRVLGWGLNQRLIQPNLKSQCSMIENVLSEQSWLAGEQFTAADIQMSYPLLVAEDRHDLRSFPKLRHYLQILKKRPAFQAAIQKGGPVLI